MSNRITVTASINADTKKVWEYYTNPEHITKWNFADPSWHCPTVTNNMTAGGSESNCGWRRDKFGLSWQIVPTFLGKLMSDPTKSQQGMKVYMQMKKFEIEKLINA